MQDCLLASFFPDVHRWVSGPRPANSHLHISLVPVTLLRPINQPVKYRT